MYVFFREAMYFADLLTNTISRSILRNIYAIHMKIAQIVKIKKVGVIAPTQLVEHNFSYSLLFQINHELL